MLIRCLDFIGCPDYAVMENGVIFRISNLRVCKPDFNNSGYARVTLSNNDGCFKKYAVHRLVCLAFIENPEDKPCVNHIDNNPMNNKLSNLEWVTHQENSDHVVVQGRTAQKEGHGKSKLNIKQIEYIKSNLDIGCNTLAKMFNVSKSAILYWRNKVEDE